MPDTAQLRAQLPAVTAQAYFNTGTFGPLPEPAVRAMAEYTEEAYVGGRIGDAKYARQAAIEQDARAALARMVSAPVEQIALAHCTSDGLNLVVGGIDWGEGDEVLIGDYEHPGLTVPLDVMGRRRGIVTRVVPITEAPDPAQAIADALTPRTRLVALSHVIWTTGRIMPIARMAEAVRAHGALFLVDAAQGPGCIPVDAPSLGCDVYTISGQKWLCGPSGTGGLWVRPDAVERIQPAFPGYPTMEKTPQGPRMWPGARRFEPGTVTHTALVGLTAAIAWREGFGVEAGHADAMRLAGHLRERLAAELPRCRVAEVDAPSPFVAFETDGMTAVEVVRRLEAQEVVVRSLPGTELTRVSVGPWNDAGDVDRLVAALAAL
ncbi:MAG: aminotransferase class V-fold PLP-dependent enzyme [Gaiellales bacterium]